MDPRRFKAPFLRRVQIWEKADELRSRFPSCATLPVPVFDLAEFDLNLELIPKARLKQAGDIDALLLGDLKTIIVDRDAFMDRRAENRLRFSVAASLIPHPFLSYLQPVQKYLRDFVREGLAQEYTGTGKSIFRSGSDGLHAPKHSVVISATQRLYSGELRFFGSAWWRFSCPLTPGVRRPHDNGFRVEIVNSFATENAKNFVSVTPID